MQAVVSQHQKELTVLHQTQQKLLDMKDKELEDFSYRLRTVTSAQQKDLEKLHQAHRAKIAEMEEINRSLGDKHNGVAMELRWANQENNDNEVIKGLTSIKYLLPLVAKYLIIRRLNIYVIFSS